MLPLLLLLAAAGPAADDRFRSPRATARTFLAAVTAAHEDDALIARAAACFDAPPGDALGLAAVRLEAVLRGREITTDQISDDPAGDRYTLPGAGTPIAMRRAADGRWLFDADTLARVPQLWAEARHKQQDHRKESAASGVPAGFATPRAAFRTFLIARHRREPDQAARCLALYDVPPAARAEVGRLLAAKLKAVIDRHGLVVLQDVPDGPYGDPFVWHSGPAGLVELAREDDGPRKGEWLFGPGCVRTIDHLFDAHEDDPVADEVLRLTGPPPGPDPFAAPGLWFRQFLPHWAKANLFTTRSVHFEVYEAAGIALALAAVYPVYRLALAVLVAAAGRLLRRLRADLPGGPTDYLRPAAALAAVAFLRLGVLVAHTDRAVLVPWLMALNPAVALVGGWAAFRLIDLTNAASEARAEALGHPAVTARMLLPIVSLIAKLCLGVGLTIHLLQMFDWDLSTVLTGLGIGGLAFALGAQDSLKNLFGSFTLIADQPFVVGDKVRIGQHEGVVEVVGLRSTRIRATDDCLLTVPNSDLTTAHIVNFGRRRTRRFALTVRLAYDTPAESVLAFREGVAELLAGRKLVDASKTELNVSGLGEMGVEVSVVVVFATDRGAEERSAREAVVLDVLRLAARLGVKFAAPPVLAAPATGTTPGPSRS